MTKTKTFQLELMNCLDRPNKNNRVYPKDAVIKALEKQPGPFVLYTNIEDSFNGDVSKSIGVVETGKDFIKGDQLFGNIKVGLNSPWMKLIEEGTSIRSCCYTSNSKNDNDEIVVDNIKVKNFFMTFDPA